jgi:hypothetical protein
VSLALTLKAIQFVINVPISVGVTIPFGVQDNGHKRFIVSSDYGGVVHPIYAKKSSTDRGEIGAHHIMGIYMPLLANGISIKGNS